MTSLIPALPPSAAHRAWFPFSCRLLSLVMACSCTFGLLAVEEPLLPDSKEGGMAHEVHEVELSGKAAYLAKRRQWLAEDAEINFSHDVHLSPEEQRLEEKVQRLVKDFQHRFLISNQFCPARNFLSIKNCVESSPLFLLLKQMPKGAVLHLHTSSTGDATWLVKRAIADKNCYIYMQDDGSVLKGKMEVFANGAAPPGFRLMSEMAAEDNGFISKIVDMITLTPEDTASPNPWVKFDACFERVGGLLYYIPIFIDYYRHALKLLAEDHIQIVELRAGSGAFHGLHDLEGKIYTPSEVFAIYRYLLRTIREEYPHFVLKLIVSDSRFLALNPEHKSLEEAFAWRADNPDLIVGYDLVGFETEGHKTLFYLDNLLDAAKTFSKKYNIDLPYFFHDGESDWSNDLNLYDAILLKSKRIGHAFNLFHFPCLMQRVKQRNICLEICPISNQLLGYVGDLRMHPAVGYLRRGLPCILGSDDPMLFRTQGLSYDFWEAIMAWNLSLADVKKLCLNSIEYSTLDEEEKKKARAFWQEAWDQFVQQSNRET